MRTFLTAVILFACATSPLVAATHDHGTMSHDAMNHDAMNHGALPTPASAPQVYQSTGVVKAWSENSVTLAHHPVPALNWPAMTMRFDLNGYQGSAFKVGQSVTFRFKQSSSGYDLISASAH